ncbi:hypothetical protein ASPCADRAFT_4450 [Aspergillus carbonarius ITEM 5010]|uniref:PKS/mFAS DH domain-containing protein n=1 Tax=Aspergillus carbonarius (strain ITEM 5010) TaxID=602072 RepID=A0A1R3RPK5_ASPC5|nr:hypothetical protein ASPCADRAFT_4450 [Aspergillus carbonarius ITEM 5010]
MAGGAIQQVTSKTEGYTVRNVLFKIPLVIGDSGTVEVITTLRPNEVNDLMNSEWFTFSIASYSSNDWTENCSGHIRAGADDQGNHVQVERYARRVSSEKWYSALFDRGLSYGTQFCGLHNISADPLGGSASASVNRVEQHESPYLIHPTMIDQCLQLISVAGAAGISRRIIKNAIPASVERMSIRRGGDHMEAGVSAKQESGNYVTADATVVFDGKVVLSMKRGMLFSMDEQVKADSIPLLAQMQWRPAIDFQQPQSLLPQTEQSAAQVGALCITKKLAFLYILRTADTIKDMHPEATHLAKWKSWILAEGARILSDSQILGFDCEKWMGMSSAEKGAIVESLSSSLATEEGDGSIIAAVCMDQIYANCQGIMSNQVSPLELLMDDNLLGRYYAHGQKYANWDVFLTLLCHSKPTLRILEIGGGTGAATMAALPSLYPPASSRQPADVLVAMGFVGDIDQLGVEGSGTVRRVGRHVTDLVVGEQVLVLGPGIFDTRFIVDQQRCRKLDKGLSLEDAANMALVYMTAVYSLVYVGQIKKGQTVLIHSACGGFGMAAIQVCRLLGAEIFATVGNQTKKDHLIHEFDIPPDHIFDSRSASFLQSLMEATGGHWRLRLTLLPPSRSRAGYGATWDLKSVYLTLSSHALLEGWRNWL